MSNTDTIQIIVTQLEDSDGWWFTNIVFLYGFHHIIQGFAVTNYSIMEIICYLCNDKGPLTEPG